MLLDAKLPLLRGGTGAKRSKWTVRAGRALGGTRIAKLFIAGRVVQKCCGGKNWMPSSVMRSMPAGGHLQLPGQKGFQGTATGAFVQQVRGTEKKKN